MPPTRGAGEALIFDFEILRAEKDSDTPFLCFPINTKIIILINSARSNLEEIISKTLDIYHGYVDDSCHPKFSPINLLIFKIYLDSHSCR